MELRLIRIRLALPPFSIPRPANIRDANRNPYFRLIVGMHSLSSVQFAACQTNCRFYYRDDNTPYITRTTPTVT